MKNDHQEIFGLLPLAAAGVLDSTEAERVEQHLTTCDICRKKLVVWTAYTRGLAQLPQPEPARDLLARTQAVVLHAEAMRAERARQPLLVLALSAFGWSMSYLLWFLLHAATGGELVVLETNLVSPEAWAVVSTALVWTSGAVAAILLARSRNEWREAV